MFRECDRFLYDVNNLPPGRVFWETPLTAVEAGDKIKAAN
jgi:hypothetical protein